MRIAAAVAMLLFATATPALATGGFECRPVSGTGPVITIGIGHLIAARPFSVTLTESGRTLATGDEGAPLVLGQSWIDARYLWLDLVDPQLERFEGQLRATFQPRLRGRPAIGTFVRNGRTYRVRCEEA